MLAVPAAFESIRKPEGPYLSIRRDNNSHPKKVAQATSIMAASPFNTKLKTSLNRRVLFVARTCNYFFPPSITVNLRRRSVGVARAPAIAMTAAT
jgi:hypothetical protein